MSFIFGTRPPRKTERLAPISSMPKKGPASQFKNCNFINRCARNGVWMGAFCFLHQGDRGILLKLMSRITYSRTRSAFTLLESLVMLVTLSIWCLVTFAVVKAKMKRPAPAPTAARPEVVPLKSLTRENPPTDTSGKTPDDGIRKAKSETQSN